LVLSPLSTLAVEGSFEAMAGSGIRCREMRVWSGADDGSRYVPDAIQSQLLSRPALTLHVPAFEILLLIGLHGKLVF
jgi:hypothetical protein